MTKYKEPHFTKEQAAAVRKALGVTGGSKTANKAPAKKKKG